MSEYTQKRFSLEHEHHQTSDSATDSENTRNSCERGGMADLRAEGQIRDGCLRVYDRRKWSGKGGLGARRRRHMLIGTLKL